MKLNSSRLRGFTLVEIMIVVGLIGLLATIAIPNLIRERGRAQRKTCIDNLRQIDAAKQQWVLENRKSDTDTPSKDDVKGYIKSDQFPTCPTSGTYTIGAANTDPTCSQSGDGHVAPSP